MATFELTGVLKFKGETVHVSTQFAKREFVVVEDPNGQFPQSIKFQFTQGNCDRLDRFPIGEEVTVKANVRGREWTNPKGEVQYFTTLDAWNISHVNEDANNHAPSAVKAPEQITNEPVDDVPF